MVINFFRLYGHILYSIDNEKKNCIFFANTTFDLENKLNTMLSIPADHILTDRMAKNWFKENYPDYTINKINKHYHFSNRDKDGDILGD